MSTSPQVAEVFAPVCHTHPATMHRYLAELRSSGLIPKSGKGGGKRAVHFNAGHFATIILSLGSPVPGGAVEAAVKLGNLTNDKSISLHAYLTNKITECTKHILEDWQISVCVTPIYEGMSLVNKGDHLDMTYWHQKPQGSSTSEPSSPDKKPGVQRVSILSSDLINVAAQLLADRS